MDRAKNIIITGEEVDFNFEELKSMGVSVFHYPMISISKIDNQTDNSIVGKWNREHIWSKSHGDFEDEDGYEEGYADDVFFVVEKQTDDEK